MTNTPLRVIPNQQNGLEILISPQSLSSKQSLKRISIGTGALPYTELNLPVSVEDEVHSSRQRRHSRTFGKKHALISDSDDSDKLPSAKWSKDQLLQHYSECMKLSQENKINHKNAFDLQLIEHMGEMIRQDGTLNFRVAGGTIFAGAKIYASRIDAIYSDIYRVLSSLSSGDKGENLGEDENDCEDPEKRIRKRKKNSKIIETTESNLRLPLTNSFSLEGFKNRSRNAAIDAASCASHMLNQCSGNIEKGILQYDFEPFPNEEEGTSTDTLHFLDIAQTNLITTDIGSEFRNAINFDQNAEDANFLLSSDSLDESVNPSTDDNVMDDYSTEDDHDIFPTINDGEPVFDAQSDQTAPEVNTDVTSAVDVAQLVAVAPDTEYSYFKLNTLSVNNGPSHWMRPKRMVRSSAVSTTSHKQGSGETPEKPHPKRRKTNEKRQLRNNDRIVLDKRLQPQKISKNKLESLRKNVQNQLLVEYTDKKTDGLQRAKELKVILQPLSSKQLQKVGVNVVESNNISTNFNYENEEFCPASVEDDYDDDNSGDIFTNNTQCFPDFSQTIGPDGQKDKDAIDYNALVEGDHLIEHPRKFEKFQVNFAKRAKRIDVRKLKKAMWSFIKPKEVPGGNSVDDDTTSENTSITSNSPKTKKQTPEKKNCSSPASSSGSQLFSQIYSQLPDRVSKNMMENLSVPLAFTCLLHLANEKELKIEGMHNLSDLKVSQGL